MAVASFRSKMYMPHSKPIVQEQEKELMVLTWPRYFSDLSLMEHLWDVLDTQV